MPSEVNITWSGFLSHHKILDLFNLPMESAELHFSLSLIELLNLPTESVELHFSLSLIELLNLPTESVELHFSLRLISVELVFSLSLILEFQPFAESRSYFYPITNLQAIVDVKDSRLAEIVVEGKGSHGVR